MKKIILPLAFAFLANSCSLLFMPKKQKVTIKTPTEESKVYVGNSEKTLLTKGDTIMKIEKKGTQNAKIITPNYLERNTVIAPVKNSPAKVPLMVADIISMPLTLGMSIMGFYIGKEGAKSHNYPELIDLTKQEKINYKSEDHKYISLSNIGVNIEDKEYDFKKYYCDYDHLKELSTLMDESEKEYAKEEKKRQEKLERKRKKKNKKKVEVLKEDKKIQFDDTYFSAEVFKLLKETGYVDTVSEIFKDEYNTLKVEGEIQGAKEFIFNNKKGASFIKLQVNMKWYFKNAYNEKLDSVSSMASSGEYFDYFNFKHDNLFQEAITRSFNNLHSNEKFINLLSKNTHEKFNESTLTLEAPTNIVENIEDSGVASVIVKLKDGSHGSGFAISNDGYILSNFHVVAGNTVEENADFTVILSDGTEIDATLVRFNKKYDIALIKTDHKFEKAFKLSDEKTFRNMMEVYTIGAPKSVELGQTLTSGLISNEREFFEIPRIQLSMSINPGNSGGPIFSKDGVLHGVVKSKLIGFTTEGVGFAIPSNKIGEYLNIGY